MDTGPVEPKSVGTPAVRALVVVGVLFVIAVVVVIGAIAARGIKKAAPELASDWKYISDVRKGDAATVEAQKKAGEAYKDKIAIQMAATANEATDKGYKVTLAGTVTNSGEQTVLKVKSPVEFLNAAGAKADSREVTLLDASELSVTDDKPLAAGSAQEFMVTVDGVSGDWDGKSIGFKVGEVRVEVPAAVESTATR